MVNVHFDEAIATKRVQEQTLAKGIVGEHQRLQFEDVGDAFEDERTGQDDVRAIRFESKSLCTFIDGRSTLEFRHH